MPGAQNSKCQGPGAGKAFDLFGKQQEDHMARTMERWGEKQEMGLRPDPAPSLDCVRGLTNGCLIWDVSLACRFLGQLPFIASTAIQT